MATNAESSVKKWINVPDKSKFILTTKADPPNVQITIEVAVDGKPKETWTTNDILNRTKTLIVRSPHRYQMAVTLKFAGSKTTLAFDARIEKPDSGGPHGKPFKFEAEPPPNSQHADISIITKE